MRNQLKLLPIAIITIGCGTCDPFPSWEETVPGLSYDSELNVFVNEFVADAERHDNTIDLLNVRIIQYADIQAMAKEKNWTNVPGNTAGICATQITKLSMNAEIRQYIYREIYLDNSMKEKPEAMKRIVMYHELGHCTLLIGDHTDHTIMSASVIWPEKYDEKEEWDALVDELFTDLSNVRPLDKVH